MGGNIGNLRSGLTIKFNSSFQPKTRANYPTSLVAGPGGVTASRFGSLPTSNHPPRLSSTGANICSTGRYSLDEGGECAGRSRSSDSRRRFSSGRGSEDSGNGLEGRTVLGMGISAVHDAVLRGVAKIPGRILDC